MYDERLSKGSVWVGLGIGALMNIVLLGILCLVVNVAVVLACGVVQLLWIVPAYLNYRGKGASETAKGILIAAGICFMLNAACWGLVLGLSRR